MIYLPAPASDLDVHLWFVHYYASGGTVRRKPVDSALQGGHLVYPPLPHALLARLPGRLRAPLGLTTNVGFDVAMVILAWAVAGPFLADTGAPPGSVLTPAAAAGLLLATSPILHPVTARLKSIGARTLSGLLLLGYHLLLFRLLEDPAWWAVAALPALGLVVTLSSQFGLQVLLLFGALLSLLRLDPVPFLTALSGPGLGILIPATGLARQLRGKLQHYAWYRSDFRGRTAEGRNRLGDLVRLPRLAVTRPLEAARVFFLKLSPVIVLYSLPVLPVVGWWALGPEGLLSGWRSDPAARFALEMSTAGLASWLLISLPPLAFLGKAERYLEYASPFLYLLFVRGLQETGATGGWVSVVLCLQVGFVLLNATTGYSDQLLAKLQARPGRDLRAVLDRIIEHGERPRIVTVPTKLAARVGRLLPDELDARLLYYHVFHADEGLDHLLEDHLAHHLVRPEPAHFVHKYGVDFFLLERRELDRYPNHGAEFPVEELDVVHENDTYLLCTPPGGGRGSP